MGFLKNKFFVVFCLLFVFVGLPCFAQVEKSQEKSVLRSEKAVVVEVDNFDFEPSALDDALEQQKQVVEVKILTGKNSGEKVILENMITGNPAYDIKLEKGDKVILHAEGGQGATDYFISDKYRSGALIFLAALFCGLLIIVGRKKGVASLVAIATTLALIYWVLAPMVLSGVNPIFATVLVCVLSAIIAIYLVGGFNPKSTSAILGTVISLSIGGVLSVFAIKIASLTGFAGEENMFLYSAHPELNFVGILASAMIIAALGAVMDVGMSISSTINELSEKSCNMSVKELFESGMNVGQDIIGTMANTLILAYLGGGLSLVLLANNIDMQKFFNLNQVATEIASAIIGSIAIVICVPITALIAAILIKKNSRDELLKGVEENAFNDII